jgi:hypothetical protein
MKNAMVQLALVLIAITSVHAVRLLQSMPSRARTYPGTAVERSGASHDKDSLRMIGVYTRGEK